jgi:hypothetical protein
MELRGHQLHQLLECRTMPEWHASAASLPLDFRIA